MDSLSDNSKKPDEQQSPKSGSGELHKWWEDEWFIQWEKLARHKTPEEIENELSLTGLYV
jgi:hypothetical protein